jgi:hypothetical protein
MKYIRETGAIISENREILSIIDGEVGHVDFPEELIWQIHKRTPGKIFELAHTHPMGMPEASGRDRQTLTTWAFALYPYPVRLSVISYDPEKEWFTKNVYLAILEPKETWKASGRELRNCEIFLENEDAFFRASTNYERILINKSYDTGGLVK